MLLNFREYDKLLSQVSDLLGNAKRCADLGAGTGNGICGCSPIIPSDWFPPSSRTKSCYSTSAPNSSKLRT